MATSRISSDPTGLGRQFKKRIKAGQFMLGCAAVEYLRPSLVKIYKASGFDFIMIDTEHALFANQSLSDFILSARDNNMAVITKCGQLDRAEIARYLEAGIVGVQLPRTETREDILGLIEIMKFPPIGSRAGAPCYGNVDYVVPGNDKDWIKKADASTAIVAHIETVAGYENAEQIVTTPQVDMVYVGPYDFSISMGHPGDLEHPKVFKPLERILKLCRKHNVAFGTTAKDVKMAARLVRLGCQFFVVSSELFLLRDGATQMVDSYRKHVQCEDRTVS